MKLSTLVVMGTKILHPVPLVVVPVPVPMVGWMSPWVQTQEAVFVVRHKFKDSTETDLLTDWCLSTILCH